MILYVQGDLFQSPAQTLVNTVNTVGVMGKGIALKFKRLYPDMFQRYQVLCRREQLKIGKLWLYHSPNKSVLNFPTKRHWRNPSRIEYVELGLKKFVNSYAAMGIDSIAFPALGCGNGQLNFEKQVRPLMEQYLRQLPIEIFIYPGQKSEFVEHLNQKDMIKWLRNEPTSLPFTEVWEDISQLLNSNNDFTTIAMNSPFVAKMSLDPLGIQILSNSRRIIIEYDTLQAFWQQLRTHGFSARHIAPGINREMSYVTSLFAKLPYIAPVHVAETYSNLERSAVTGLQILPSAFVRSEKQQTKQLTLFDM